MSIQVYTYTTVNTDTSIPCIVVSQLLI